MTHRVAIVGAGPSGFYAADGLLRGRPDLRIDIIDRLPTPFGLVRAGVAPDHQGTKAVVRQFDKLLDQPDVRFAGNLDIGRDLTWDELVEAYDAVIVATGMVIDRKLGIPGEELPQVWGSWRFVGWLNGHPDFREGPDLSAVKSVAVIGNGNVALDVARLLAKTPDEMAKSDIVPEAAAAIAAAPLTDIHVIGRRGAEQASFTTNELAEMGRLARAVSVADASVLDAVAPAADPTPERLRKAKNIETLKGFAAHRPGEKPVTVHFRFHATPLAIRPGEIELSTGTIPADLVVTCIGYTGEAFPEADGVFAVGWARRGPSGTIPTNRADSHAVAKDVIAWLEDRDPKSGPDILPLAVDAEGWRRIDKAEVAAGAAQGRPRLKLVDRQALLDIAQGD
ncbi:FAD-dependent oxidoreductase [Reyranella sp. MMS21-HV4-11]|uniref:FAD-dependent oxidoreductase n=1 Tax=Reyranella humidisoli TaxID=2849149 RepID=A0ABS6IIF8_9HYPH|nr:FAD-dependent oxidoreductase [Reyranella sp. MMS21-HV4-11]MBU8874048.1 FAD-dependent oxidoreductase [Reyranella sp. MMS21-HV4-11]